MSKRTMYVTLEIVVTDMSDEDRAEDMEIDARAGSGDEDEIALPVLADYDDPTEIAGVLQEGISPETTLEMFAGSGLFVQFESALLIGAEWTTPLSGSVPK